MKKPTTTSLALVASAIAVAISFAVSIMALVALTIPQGAERQTEFIETVDRPPESTVKRTTTVAPTTEAPTTTQEENPYDLLIDLVREYDYSPEVASFMARHIDDSDIVTFADSYCSMVAEGLTEDQITTFQAWVVMDSFESSADENSMAIIIGTISGIAGAVVCTD